MRLCVEAGRRTAGAAPCPLASLAPPARLPACHAAGCSPRHPRPGHAPPPAATPRSPPRCRVLTWGQEKIGKCYLVGGRLAGPDVAESGAPQRWGIARAADLLLYVPSGVAVTNLEALASALSGSLGAPSDALLQQLGSLALPSLAEEAGEHDGAEGRACGAAAAAAAPQLAAQRSRGALLARRLSQRLLAQGSQGHLRLAVS